jgi:hypothetical protein
VCENPVGIEGDKNENREEKVSRLEETKNMKNYIWELKGQ